MPVSFLMCIPKHCWESAAAYIYHGLLCLLCLVEPVMKQERDMLTPAKILRSWPSPVLYSSIFWMAHGYLTKTKDKLNGCVFAQWAMGLRRGMAALDFIPSGAMTWYKETMVKRLWFEWARPPARKPPSASGDWQLGREGAQFGHSWLLLW